MTGIFMRKPECIVFTLMLLLDIFWCTWPVPVAFGDDMRGPAPLSRPDTPSVTIESSPVKLAMRGAIRSYQVCRIPHQSRQVRFSAQLLGLRIPVDQRIWARDGYDDDGRSINALQHLEKTRFGLPAFAGRETP